MPCLHLASDHTNQRASVLRLELDVLTNEGLAQGKLG